MKRCENERWRKEVNSAREGGDVSVIQVQINKGGGVFFLSLRQQGK